MKEHVVVCQNMPQPPYFYLPWMNVWMSAALKGWMKWGIASYEMVDLYAPQGVDLGGGGSPQEKSRMTQYGKWSKQEKTVKCIQ